MKLLSYYLSSNTPLYGNSDGINFVPEKQIRNNDSCNTMNVSFPNHSGTHIDFPYHFNPAGKTINDYPAEYWQFDHVELTDLSGKVDDCQIIDSELFSDLVNPKKIIPTFIKFVDIAGLVHGASKGEGLGNQFLSHIRDVDAVIHVV